MLSIKPRQRAGKKGVKFKLVKSKFSEAHCERLFQNFWVDLQCRKRYVSVSGEPAQKEQESASFLPILRRKSFVATLLCHNLIYWNTLNFVSVVHRKVTGIFPVHLYIWKNIFSKPLSGFSLVRKSIFWPKSDKSFCKLSQKRTGCRQLFQGSEVWFLEHFFLIIIKMNFIKVSCLIAQAQCL